MSMSNPIGPTVFDGLADPAPSLAVPQREQQQGIADRRLPERKNAQGSQLAALAATTGAGKIGYGALAFWIVVAVLIAARVAFLDTSRIASTSSLFGAKSVSAWTTGEGRSPKD
jgi:hypothetical protein